MPDPTPQQILDTPMPGENDAGAETIRGYLASLLAELWREGECFSGKRPFGNSGWDWDLYAALAEAGHLQVITDKYGDVDIDDANRDAGDRMIQAAIRSLAVPAEPAPPAELTEAQRCPSCEHLTEGHTAAGCWYVIDDHSPSVDGICPCTRVHKPAATPEQDGGQAEGECTCSDLPDAPLCAACEHSMAAAVRGLGAPCTGCALVESSCRAHGGRCCDLCQHHTPEDPR